LAGGAAGVAFFFKQWGEWVNPKQAHPTLKSNSFASSGDLFKAGKKRAGRLLDGVLHDAMPERDK